MKKYLLTIFLFILIIPTVVFAASTCNPSDIEIETVTMSKKGGNATEVTAASINEKKIDLDVKLYDPSDYIEYTIKVQNNGTEDYYIKEKNFTNNQYFKYEFIHENDSYKIEPNEEKDITLRVSYLDRVDGNANYTSTDSLKLSIYDNQGVNVANTLMNLNLGLKILIGLVIIAIIAGLVILFVNNKKSRKMLILLIGIALFIPITSDASCDATIDVDVNIELDSKDAIFDSGSNVNILMKTLAGTTIGSSGTWTVDSTVTAFKKSTTEPEAANKTASHVASSADSPLPIYMWYSSGTIWWWSEDETPSFGEDGSNFFAGFGELTNIEGATTFNTTNSTNLSTMFTLCSKLTNYTPIANWNTSNNTSLAYAFYSSKISDLTSISNWDVSKVTSMEHTFQQASQITTLEGLRNWDTSSLVNISYMFYLANGITTTEPIKNWDTSKVENCEGTFLQMSALTTINLSGWNTGNVTTMENMFGSSASINSLEGISNFDTSNVTTMKSMFYGVTGVTTTAPIKDWNVTKVQTLESTFGGMTNLATADLSGWVTTSLTNMDYTFNQSGVSVIDISNFDTRNVTSFASCFWGSDNLSTIYIGANWSTSANTGSPNYVFPNESTLPNFSTSNGYPDIDYRHLTWAKPSTEGGYLTVKPNS